MLIVCLQWIVAIVIAGGSSNLGSAVATSMNLTNSSEPMGDSGPNGAYKMEGPHDMMYPYQVRTLTKARHSAILIIMFPLNGQCCSVH